MRHLIKQKRAYPYNGILFSHKKEWSIDTCYNTGKTLKHYVRGLWCISSGIAPASQDQSPSSNPSTAKTKNKHYAKVKEVIHKRLHKLHTEYIYMKI
jgi:hypothetical protein